MAIAVSGLFNEAGIQKNQSEWFVYFITIPKGLQHTCLINK